MVSHFTMHLIKCYAERNHAVERFPSFEAIFEDRPEVMRADLVLSKRDSSRMQVPRPL